MNPFAFNPRSPVVRCKCGCRFPLTYEQCPKCNTTHAKHYSGNKNPVTFGNNLRRVLVVYDLVRQVLKFNPNVPTVGGKSVYVFLATNEIDGSNGFKIRALAGNGHTMDIEVFTELGPKLTKACLEEHPKVAIGHAIGVFAFYHGINEIQGVSLTPFYETPYRAAQSVVNVINTFFRQYGKERRHG